MKLVCKTFFIVLVAAVYNIGLFANAESSDISEVHADAANNSYEAALIGVIDAIQKQDLAVALEKVNDHLILFPRSREGHLMRADILNAMSGNFDEFGDHKLIEEESLKKFKHQLNNRLKHVAHEADKAHNGIPSNLILIGEHKHVLVADMTNGRLYLYGNEDGAPVLIRDYYLSIGSQGYGKEVEGDNRTPVGVYEINRYIEGKALPDLYGKGAFPINYPNRYDRFLKRTGYGIWLHGTPSNTYARSPWSSEGCFVLSNDDLIDIGQYISAEDRTPVILSDEIEWVDKQTYQERKDKYISIVDSWKKDWEALDMRAYIAHYSSVDFNFSKEDYEGWVKRKINVNKAKTFVQLDFDIKSLFVYPGDKEMFIVKFKQRYLSNNYSGESEKEQYWQKDDLGQWRIIYEG